jgi:hypothetical protein
MTVRPLSRLPRRMMRTGLVLLLVGLLGCRSSEPGLLQLILQFTIATKESLTRQEMERADGRYTSIRFDQQGNHCRGGGGFSDFQASTPVEVFDQNGRLLGHRTLGAGTLEVDGRDLEGEPLHAACHFKVAIPLAAEGRIYILRIGREALVRRLHVSELRRTKGVVRIEID